MTLLMRRERDTAIDMLDIDLLRTLLRGLEPWRASYEDYGDSVQVLASPNGLQWSIWDVEAIYTASQKCLPVRQAQAIRLFLVEGRRESDVAVMMGIKPTNPIGMYATEGLRTIVELIQDHRLFD